jgi:hypothetical protein
MAIRHTTKADSSFSAQGKRVWEEDHTGDASDLAVQSGTAPTYGWASRTMQAKAGDLLRAVRYSKPRLLT